MDRQQLLPIGKGEVDERIDDLNTGVADEDVDLAILADHVGHTLLDLGLVGDVDGDSEGVAIPGLDLLGRLACRVEIEIGDDG